MVAAAATIDLIRTEGEAYRHSLVDQIVNQSVNPTRPQRVEPGD